MGCGARGNNIGTENQQPVDLQFNNLTFTPRGAPMIEEGWRERERNREREVGKERLTEDVGERN